VSGRLWLRVLVPLAVAALATLALAKLGQGGQATPRYPVVVATHALAAGTVLGTGDLELVERPELAPGDVQDKASLVGLVTTVPLAAGEAVRSEDAVTPSSLGLGYALPAGQRALTLGLTPVEAVGYQLAAGDRVDAFVTVLSGARGAPFAKSVEQDLRVLAVAPPQAGASSGEVTLAVTPEEASVLLLGQAVGSVTLVLRPHGDRARASASAGVGALAP
jgi:Flp pilus assembly protein CpaB